MCVDRIHAYLTQSASCFMNALAFAWTIDLMRSRKKSTVILTVSLCLYLFIFHGNLKKLFSRTGQEIKSSVVLNYVVVHLDLKGAPPKLQYLDSLLPKLKHNGVNGLLIEYEDMFPYEGNLINISAKNSYDRYELKKFITKSTRLGIQVIPLIQTYGHIEHVLKLQEFRHLRELQDFPDSMCPSRDASIELVKNMLEQVIMFHLSIAPLKHIHIGCDEVYHMNKCKLCRSKNITKINLYYNHIHKVDLIVQQLSPHTTVLIWDDMLRGNNGLKSTTVDLSNIEPVYWDYKPQLRVTHVDLLNHHKKFKNIWIASAFKGADGRGAILPNIQKRFNNNLSWLEFIADYKFENETNVFNFKGIILTGWSRYSHMDPLCELLPVSLPSLMLNLLLIKTMKKGIDPPGPTNLNVTEFYTKYLETEFKKKYNCDKMTYFDTSNISTCRFDTRDLYNELINYNKLNNLFTSTDNSIIFSSIGYHAQMKNINRNTVKNQIRRCNDSLKKIFFVKRTLKKYMSSYYEKVVIDEYVAEKMNEIVLPFRNTIRILQSYFETSTWGRRPYNNIL